MTKGKRKELLNIPLTRLTVVDNLGDPNCKTCSGHGCVDDGNAFGCIMEYCPDCYNSNNK